MSKQIKSNACLLGTAIIWGFAFVAQKDGMNSIGPFLYSAIRMLIGSATLAVMFIAGDRIKGKPHAEKNTFSKKTLLTGGAIAGIVMFFAANLQQVGLVYTNA